MFRRALTPSNKIERGMPRPGVVTYAVMLAARVPGVDNEDKQKSVHPTPLCSLCCALGVY